MNALSERRDEDQARSARLTLDLAELEHHGALVLLDDVEEDHARLLTCSWRWPLESIADADRMLEPKSNHSPRIEASSYRYYSRQEMPLRTAWTAAWMRLS